MTAFPFDPLVPLAMAPRLDAPAPSPRAEIQVRDILPLPAWTRRRRAWPATSATTLRRSEPGPSGALERRASLIELGLGELPRLGELP